MQTIVCQTAESFSPDLPIQAQSLQKPRESDGPKESDFLSMLNESVKKEAASKESEPAKESGRAEESETLAKSGEAESEARGQEKVQEGEKVVEKVVEKAEPKKLAKKESARESEAVKVDAYINGALNAAEGKQAVKKNGAKTEKNGVQKIAAKSEEKKIDPRQLDFLKKISGKASENEGEGLKEFVSKAAKDPKELSFPAESLLFGQKVVRDESDFTYVQERGGQPKAEAGSKISELKKNSKKPLIQVTDLRTKAEAAAQKESAKAPKKNFAVTLKETGKASVQMTLDLNSQAQKNILSLDSQSAASDGSTFQAMLKNQITQNAGDFVKAANIVLRDGNQGQIDMILHPEELGNVRISMEVRGKEIIGHVTVASREAMEAFEQSSQALKNSFLQSGFESASFDVSFAGSQMQFAQQNASGQNDESRAMQGRKIYGEFAQESLTSLDDVSDTFIDDDVSVNIVA